MKYILILMILITCGCASQIDKYLDLKYPGCETEKISSDALGTTVKITCPNKEPFEKMFKER